MAPLLVLVIGVLPIYLSAAPTEARYPKEVFHIRNEFVRGGFVKGPITLFAKNVTFFGRTKTTNDEGLHLDFREKACCRKEAMKQGSTAYCDLHDCHRGILDSVKENQTHLCIEPENPGVYSCKDYNGARRAIYVMPLLVVHAKRFFSISLDFLKLPKLEPHYYVEPENQIVITVDRDVPVVTGFIREPTNSSADIPVYRVDFQLENGRIETIKFRLKTKEDSSNYATPLKATLKYRPGGTELSLYRKLEVARCLGHLLSINFLHMHQVEFDIGKMLRVNMKVDEIIECRNLTWDTKLDRCVLLDIRTVAVRETICRTPFKSPKVPRYSMNNFITFPRPINGSTTPTSTEATGPVQDHLTSSLPSSSTRSVDKTQTTLPTLTTETTPLSTTASRVSSVSEDHATQRWTTASSSKATTPRTTTSSSTTTATTIRSTPPTNLVSTNEAESQPTKSSLPTNEGSTPSITENVLDSDANGDLPGGGSRTSFSDRRFKYMIVGAILMALVILVGIFLLIPYQCCLIANR